MSEFLATPAPNQSVMVHPKGRLNISVARELRQELLELIEHGQTRIVVDLIDVEAIDSSILGCLIAALKLARSKDGDLRIVGPSPHVAEVLRMTGLSRVLPSYECADTAFAS